MSMLKNLPHKPHKSQKLIEKPDKQRAKGYEVFMRFL